jgi:hypothetical protein
MPATPMAGGRSLRSTPFRLAAHAEMKQRLADEHGQYNNSNTHGHHNSNGSAQNGHDLLTALSADEVALLTDSLPQSSSLSSSSASSLSSSASTLTLSPSPVVRYHPLSRVSSVDNSHNNAKMVHGKRKSPSPSQSINRTIAHAPLSVSPSVSPSRAAAVAAPASRTSERVTRRRTSRTPSRTPSRDRLVPPVTSHPISHADYNNNINTMSHTPSSSPTVPSLSSSISSATNDNGVMNGSAMSTNVKGISSDSLDRMYYFRVIYCRSPSHSFVHTGID